MADAAFCYPCRQFSTGPSDAFTTTGFRNWAVALTEGKGLKQHDKGHHHCVAMSAWSEKKKRLSKRSEVSSLLSANVLERRRYYMKAIVRTLMFLAKNELALRGNWNSIESNENGMGSSIRYLNSSHQKIQLSKKQKDRCPKI